MIDGAPQTNREAALGASLQNESPAVFDELVGRFEKLVEETLEQKFYRVSGPTSIALGDIANRLGEAGAGPRDVIEIYGTAIKRSVRSQSRTKLAAFADIGQLLSLELMGYLVTYYRNLVCSGKSSS